MTPRRFLVVKAIVWTEMILVSATLISGSTYLSALLIGYHLLASISGPVAALFATLLVLGILVLFVAGFLLRIFRQLTRTQTPLDRVVEERVRKLGTEVSSKMSMKRPVMFLVRRGLFGAGAARGDRIVVGERLAQDSTDQELEGAIAHELAHILRKHLPIKAAMTVLPILVLLVSFAFAEPTRLWQIVVPVAFSWLLIVELPIFWKRV